jgi:endonuclease I
LGEVVVCLSNSTECHSLSDHQDFFHIFAKIILVKQTTFNRTFLRSVLTILLVIFLTGIFAQIPPGYYDPAAGKTGTALQTALHNIIKGHTVVSYSSIPGFFPATDAKPGSVVWDMYSDVPGGTPPYMYHYNMGQECGNYGGEGDCYNREHSWPKSWFNDVAPMNSDMFHIYPTDGYVNGKRNNYPYGTVSTASWTSQNGCKLGSCNWPGYSGTVFEPLDEYKGDFARTYFYMSTRYYTEDASWNVTDMTNKSQLKPWALQMMLHWSNVDPVSVKETNRNNAMYGIQHNRNPFIDHPEYASLIWGNPVGMDGKNSLSYQLEVYPNPAVDFCSVAVPEGTSGEDLRPILVSVTGAKLTPEYSREGNKFHLDIRLLPKGLYFLILSSDQAIYRAIVVKA